jgi:SAM-dependent methyltransferase
METDVIEKLIELNRRFYGEYAADFAATRKRIQPGVARALDGLPDRGRWLDLGCGSGSLAVEWLLRGHQSAYVGLDFSPGLLEEARAAVAGLPGAERVSFVLGDLGTGGICGVQGPFSGAVCFAALHHLPSADRRRALLAETARLLEDRAVLALSVWQFQHSPKLMARRLPWEAAGLRPEQVEPGDTLLDWRSRPNDPGGLRYVHLFDSAELRGLAADTGFVVTDEYESDGRGGRLALYQVWQKQALPDDQSSG